MSAPLTSELHSTLDRVEHVFCSAHCRDQFAAAPSKYLPAPAPQAAHAAPVKTVTPPSTRGEGSGKAAVAKVPSGEQAGAGAYTCPMHPEVRSDRPGACPKCGMALEPVIASAGEGEKSDELHDMLRRLWFSVALTVPLVILAMGDLLPGQPISRLLSAQARTMIELGLATPVCTWAAYPFYVRAVQSVKNKSLNMFTLIGG